MWHNFYIVELNFVMKTIFFFFFFLNLGNITGIQGFDKHLIIVIQESVSTHRGIFHLLYFVHNSVLRYITIYLVSQTVGKLTEFPFFFPSLFFSPSLFYLMFFVTFFPRLDWIIHEPLSYQHAFFVNLISFVLQEEITMGSVQT